MENLWQPGIPDQCSNYLLCKVGTSFMHEKLQKKNRDVLTLDSVAEHSRPLNTFSANFQELLFEYVCNDFCSSLKSFFFTMFLKLIFQIMFDNTQLPCIYSAKKIFFLKFFSPKFFKIIQRGFHCLVNTYS